MGHGELAAGPESFHRLPQLLGHGEAMAGVVDMGDQATHARVAGGLLERQGHVAHGELLAIQPQAGDPARRQRLGQLLAQVGHEQDLLRQGRSGLPHEPGHGGGTNDADQEGEEADGRQEADEEAPHSTSSTGTIQGSAAPASAHSRIAGRASMWSR